MQRTDEQLGYLRGLESQGFFIWNAGVDAAGVMTVEWEYRRASGVIRVDPFGRSISDRAVA